MSTRSRSTGPVSAVRSDWPVAPDFHPEFGFLCPSPSRLRRLRVAMTLTLAGIGIGATIELAVAHWGDSGAAAQTLIAGPIEEEPLGKAAAVPRPSGIRIASMQPSESAALTETWPLPQHGSCKDAVSRDPAASFSEIQTVGRARCTPGMPGGQPTGSRPSSSAARTCRRRRQRLKQCPTARLEERSDKIVRSPDDGLQSNHLEDSKSWYWSNSSKTRGYWDYCQ